jgi:streptomycin 6-kinase
MAGGLRDGDVERRFADWSRAWSVSVDRLVESDTSLIGYGRRHTLPVVLKVLKQCGDEWTSGKAISAFDANGVARAYEHAPGALLLEQLTPGTSLDRLVVDGRDREATDIIADVMHRMASPKPPQGAATVEDWGRAFGWYRTAGLADIPPALVDDARRRFVELSRSQQQVRFLHGDLHHSNVLHDARRGWLAVDPKGVVGEREYEVGAMLRNPVEHPECFLSARAVERRIAQLADRLRLDAARALGWAFAQAILAAIWKLQDGGAVPPDDSAVTLAQLIRPMLDPLA